VSRLAGAARTLPQDMMALVAEIDKGERAIKMAALQASEKDIDQIQAANMENMKQKRALFQEIVKQEARTAAAGDKGPFGTGVTGATLNIFSKMAPDYAAGKLNPEQERVFLSAVTNYTQAQMVERVDPVTGNKSYVEIRNDLPAYVRTALDLRGGTPPVTPTTARPGAEKPPASNVVSGAPGTVPANVPAEAKDTYVALNTPADQKTLWNQRGLVAGPLPYIKTMPVLRVFGQIDPKADEARTFFDTAVRDLIKSLQNNPHYATTEMKAIEKELDIGPAFFDNPSSLGSRMVGIDDFLMQKLNAAQIDATNESYTLDARKNARNVTRDIINFQKKAGIPPRVYTIEEVQALPSGTNFLWNGTQSKWKK